MFEIVFGLLVLAGAVYIFIILPMNMAKTRDRNPFGWVLISLLASPLVAIIGLLVLGRALPSSSV